MSWRPDLWRQPSASVRHWQLVREALDSLAIELQGLGGELCVRIGSSEQILNELHLELALPFTHEETGETWTYAGINVLRSGAANRVCNSANTATSEYFAASKIGMDGRDAGVLICARNFNHATKLACAVSTADWQAWQPELPGERITITPGLNPQLSSMTS